MTCGYFSSDGAEIRYLNRSNQSDFEALLARDDVFPDDIDPLLIARLFTAILLDDGNNSHIVIDSLEDILSLTGTGRYVIDENECKKYASVLREPTMEKQDLTGWSLEFYTLSGWMHSKKTLALQRFEITPDYEITLTSEVLSDLVFSSVPNYLY
jgi:hypothetical protein